MKHGRKLPLSNNRTGREPIKKCLKIGSQIYSNNPYQYHCQLNFKCFSWEWFLQPVGTGLTLHTEFTKLVPYGASCCFSNQASFQESDPFQWEKCSSQVNGAWTSQSLAAINLSQKCIVQVSASDITQQTSEMHHSASEPFHIHLKCSPISWPKEDSSCTGFSSWICYLRQAERTLPLFQIPQQGQKSFTLL